MEEHRVDTFKCFSSENLKDKNGYVDSSSSHHTFLSWKKSALEV
jgi:hypothetical protein